MLLSDDYLFPQFDKLEYLTLLNINLSFSHKNTHMCIQYIQFVSCFPCHRCYAFVRKKYIFHNISLVNDDFCDQILSIGMLVATINLNTIRLEKFSVSFLLIVLNIFIHFKEPFAFFHNYYFLRDQLTELFLLSYKLLFHSINIKL